MNLFSPPHVSVMWYNTWFIPSAARGESFASMFAYTIHQKTTPNLLWLSRYREASRSRIVSLLMQIRVKLGPRFSTQNRQLAAWFKTDTDPSEKFGRGRGLRGGSWVVFRWKLSLSFWQVVCILLSIFKLTGFRWGALRPRMMSTRASDKVMYTAGWRYAPDCWYLFGCWIWIWI